MLHSCRNDVDNLCFFRILLHCMVGCHWHTISQHTWRGSFMLPSLLCNIWRIWCMHWRLQLALTTFSCTLPCSYLSIWCTYNGLCSSITELKHIKAVKQLWRWPSHYKALGQMLLTNEHLNKIAACHADFGSCGMLADVILGRLSSI